MQSPTISNLRNSIRIKRHPKRSWIPSESTNVSVEFQPAMENTSPTDRSSCVSDSHNERISSSFLKDVTLRSSVVWPEKDHSQTNLDEINKNEIKPPKKCSSRRLTFFIGATVASISLIAGIIAFVVVAASRKPTILSTTITTETSTTSITTSTSSTASTSTSSSSTSSSTSSTSTTTTKTTSTSTSTTTTYSCSASEPVTLGTVVGTSTLTFTQYAYSYTATKIVPTLLFGIGAPTSIYIYLDDISVVDTSNNTIQLLRNPGFENSSTALTGWGVWCSSRCGSGSVGAISSSSTYCRTGNCYRGQCSTANSDYLVQTFPAVIGRTYNISFWFYRYRGGAPSTATLYIGIV